MTSPEIPARGDRWLRAVGYGLLAEIATIIAIVLVVMLAAIALSIGGSIAGHQGVPTAYLLASALKIIAGALVGFLYERSEVRNRTFS
ncbi:MAG: hypothetical protein M3P26_11175 [Gemmatimonadota bacterium]|nr:hypothetical protein [Gemmatimonadota bacterium]